MKTDFINDDKLIRLPHFYNNQSGLRIINCPNFQGFHKNFQGESLLIRHCPKFTHFNESFNGDDCWVYDCDNFLEMPKGYTHERFFVVGCEKYLPRVVPVIDNYPNLETDLFGKNVKRDYLQESIDIIKKLWKRVKNLQLIKIIYP
jgi:hypothetical protein